MKFNPHVNSKVMVISKNGIKKVIHYKGKPSWLHKPESFEKLKKKYGVFFIKVHESFLINVKFIKRYYPKNKEFADVQGDRGHLILEDYDKKEYNVPVSRAGAEKLFKNENFLFIKIK